MAASLTLFSQNEILGNRGTAGVAGGSIGLAASDFWLTSIQTNASQSAVDRLEDMRQMRGKILSQRSMDVPFGDPENPPTVQLGTTDGRSATMSECICQAIDDHPEGVVITIELADGTTHAVAGYRRQLPEKIHFFDPHQGEYVADHATDLYLAIIGLVTSRLRELYAKAESIRPLPRKVN